MATVQVDIVTPERKVFQGEADIVIARGVEGELGVMAGHIPLVTPLKTAPVRIKQGDKETLIAVSGGFLEVRPDKVNILADTAELPEEIDVERAKKAKARHETILKRLDKTDKDYLRHKRALERAEVRLQVANSKS
ncbi:ATP synthase F1, epsilon subunit [Caldalkalibacillus thermarum TA2.A1]|uniref:ATP synthase epsilon chain n=2 Tax=Bacillaceae TaxID=186817 RepID=F5LA71_CALTT|nr:F0F1 ATP synthase subunit epsilon [Caldalkalibacillus thermarum]2QE7_H Chain H, ATP synthase subunit epsilon [Bacillus sp. TA2.A1]5HKK_H Chain H, ATP synthase epsilon chain [Caldalkalibacillus thermarum TA2.A1]5HKK_P Chain P, ATP synthase epsilon chain [Caldalkalibacillus thermarum TA2.A1]AAQ10091.1 ATP synthase subunit epsilon [Bacillus sp. TA2.A1]EGL81791.1 ATP synthase F1, epsilon subunit [Caldalkalibacillus thermarum TA2.A1]QZT34165.1 F0F1 ATP synthase subunit epsilon [Caldalkalibacill